MDTTDTELTTTEAHQAWVRRVTVKICQAVLVIFAVFLALALMNSVSENKSDAKDFAECISANIGPCD